MPKQKFKELATKQHKSDFNRLYDKYVKENQKIIAFLEPRESSEKTEIEYSEGIKEYSKRKRKPEPNTSSFTPREAALIKLHHKLNETLKKECRTRDIKSRQYAHMNPGYQTRNPGESVPPQRLPSTFKSLFDAITQSEQKLEKEELSTISKHGKFKNFEPNALPKTRFTPEKEKEPEHSETTGMEMKEITNSFKEKLTEAKKNTPNTGRSADSSDEENNEEQDEEPRATL